MFRMLGKRVELIRYIVTWQEDERKMQENCISEEHKAEAEQRLTGQGIEFTTETIEQTGNEWFNGLEFDSYDKAREVFESGEEAYLQQLALKQLTDNLRLRADIDYLAVMSEVEI